MVSRVGSVSMCFVHVVFVYVSFLPKQTNKKKNVVGDMNPCVVVNSMNWCWDKPAGKEGK